MKKRTLVLCIAVMISSLAVSAMNVVSRFRSVPIDNLRSAFVEFLEGHKADPLMPSIDILDGATTINANESGMTVLYIGKVSFGFDKFAKSGDIVAVVICDSIDGTKTLRCVFTMDDAGVLTLKEFSTVLEKPHL